MKKLPKIIPPTRISEAMDAKITRHIKQNRITISDLIRAALDKFFEIN
jgi:hypothetical protein